MIKKKINIYMLFFLFNININSLSIKLLKINDFIPPSKYKKKIFTANGDEVIDYSATLQELQNYFNTEFFKNFLSFLDHDTRFALKIEDIKNIEQIINNILELIREINENLQMLNNLEIKNLKIIEENMQFIIQNIEIINNNFSNKQKPTSIFTRLFNPSSFKYLF